MPDLEKRQYVRVHFKRRVQLDFFSEVYDTCNVKNISLGGLFVHGEFPCTKGDQCSVNIFLTSQTKTMALNATAKVVRKDGEGVALKFISMSFESLVVLELILLYEPREQTADTAMKLPADLPFEISEEMTAIPDK